MQFSLDTVDQHSNKLMQKLGSISVGFDFVGAQL